MATGSPACSLSSHVSEANPIAAYERPKFDTAKFLSTMGIGRCLVEAKRNATVYTQGEPCSTLYYILSGKIRLSMVSRAGKEATIGILSATDFFGESSASGRLLRTESARALVDANLLRIDTKVMLQNLRKHANLSSLFARHLLSRNARLQEDLADQLFNSSEMRLARILLVLADYGGKDGPRAPIPKISQEVLAEMVGTTRSRVSFFMNKFRRLGFIDYDGTIAVHSSLLSELLGLNEKQELTRREKGRPGTGLRVYGSLRRRGSALR